MNVPMPSAIYALTDLIQLAMAFVVLTAYGAFWKGAESEGRKGWLAALLAAVAVVLIDDWIDLARASHWGCRPL